MQRLLSSPIRRKALGILHVHSCRLSARAGWPPRLRHAAPCCAMLPRLPRLPRLNLPPAPAALPPRPPCPAGLPRWPGWLWTPHPTRAADASAGGAADAASGRAADAKFHQPRFSGRVSRSLQLWDASPSRAPLHSGPCAVRTAAAQVHAEQH